MPLPGRPRLERERSTCLGSDHHSSQPVAGVGCDSRPPQHQVNARLRVTPTSYDERRSCASPEGDIFMEMGLQEFRIPERASSRRTALCGTSRAPASHPPVRLSEVPGPERAQSGEVAAVRFFGGGVLRGLDHHRHVEPAGIAHEEAESVQADFALADVGVAVDGGAEIGDAIIDVPAEDAVGADRVFERGHHAVVVADDVVAGGEEMAAVETDADERREVRRGRFDPLDDVRKLVEVTAEQVARAGGVLDEDTRSAAAGA